MILKILLNTKTIQKIFVKTLKNTTQKKKSKILNVFDGMMIADMFSNKKLNPIVTKLFIRARKLNISLVLTAQYYFAVPKNTRLNSMD